MPRNDPRTQRGLAVQRRMQNLGVGRGQPAALQHAAAAFAELARARQAVVRAGMADELVNVYMRGGWPALRSELVRSGALSADALALADSLTAKRGLPGLVEPLIRHETAQAQDAAERELSSFAQSLSPEDAARAEQIYNEALAQGGPEHAARTLASAITNEVSPAAATIAYRTLQAGGLSGLASGLAMRQRRDADHEAERAAWEAAQEHAKDHEGRSDLPEGAIPAVDALRDPQFQREAARLLPALRERGLVLPTDGRSPGATLVRSFMTLAGMSGNEDRNVGEKRVEPHEFAATVAELADGRLGNARQVQAMFDNLGAQWQKAGLLARRAEADRVHRDNHPEPELPPEEKARRRAEAEHRTALEAKYDELEAKENARRAHVEELSRPQPKPEPPRASWRDTMRAKYDEMASEPGPEPVIQPAAEDEPDDRRESLSRAYDALGGEGGES